MSIYNLAKKRFFQGKIDTRKPVPIHQAWGMSSLEEISFLLGLERGERIEFLNQYSEEIWVYVCTFDVSEAAASVPLKLFSKNDPQKEIEKHDLLDIMDKPNLAAAKHEFKFANYAYLELHGNTYIYLAGNNINIPVSRTNPPRSMFVLLPDLMNIKRGRLRPIEQYLYTVNGSITKFDPIEIIHPRYFNPRDRALGQSTIAALKKTLLENKHAREFQGSFFKNSLVPSGVLSTDDKLGDKQFDRLKKQIEEKFTGKGRSHKPLLLEQGTSWQSIAMTPKDVEFLNKYVINRDEILSAFGEPPTIAGIPTANYAQSKIQEQIFWTKTIIPKVNRFTDFLNLSLCPFFGDDLFFKPDTSGIQALHESITDTTSMLSSLTDILISKNEGRKFLNINFGMDLPNVGKEGDKLYVAGNLFEIGDVSGGKAIEVPKEDVIAFIEDRRKA